MISTIPPINLKGYVRLENEAGDVVESNNLVVYRAGDIITAAVSGNTAYKLTHMYFAFENTVGTPAPISPARTDTAALFHSFVNPRDFIRAAVVPPTFSASDVNHTANRATYMAIATAATGVLGRPFGAGNNSKVFSLGIVASPTGVYTGDVLYAHFSLPTALAAVGSGQVSASWTLEVI